MAMDAPAVPPEKLPPPEKMAGIGNVSLTITTASPEAQMWFTQGLNLFHDFWDYESSRAFEQSVRVDPTCAMCWWGLYQAEVFRGENDAWARAALDQAVRLKKHASRWEQLYIEAAVEAEKEKAQEKKSKGRAASGKGWSVEGEQTAHVDSKETKVWRKVVALRPEDTEAKIFLAESLIDGFDKHAEPKPGTREAQAILAGILKEHPEDSAANHYWIHAQEPGLHPEAALESAKKLGRLAPASGHMVHMPGHIFYRLGDYEQARTAFEASMHTDEAYMRAQHVSVDDDWNYVHNLMYLIADLMEEGRMAEATEMSAKLSHARGDRLTTLYAFSARDGMTRLNPQLPVALRSADWERATALLEASAPDASLVNLVWLKGALLNYTRGMEDLNAHNAEGAERESKALDAALQAMPKQDPMKPMPGMPGSKDAMPAPLHSYMDVAALELKASALMANGKDADADTTFGNAADAERALGYHEPPNYIRPVGESRGDALLRAKRYVNARAAYEAALQERPNSGFALFGMAETDEEAGNEAAAVKDYRAFLEAWKDADPDLPQLALARAYLSRSVDAMLTR
jgi:tetratricopeptide (TPR) repeat protein